MSDQSNREFHGHRRRFLLGSTVTAMLASGIAGRAHAANPAVIPQPEYPGPEAYIRRAFAMRDLAAETGDQPYGAIVVRGDRIVGQSPSRVIVDRDPTAHAELTVIRQTARNLGTRDLGGCVLYSSSRPCPMCEAAAYWAGIEKFVYGQTATDGGAPALCR